MYTAIVAVENNRVAKYKEFETADAAQAHCDVYGGFPYEGSYSPDLYIDGQTVTVQPEQETAEQVIARLKAEMAAIEAEQYLIRGAREAWLVLMENMAADQGVSQAVLYAANPFYKKIKDADTLIAGMRAEIEQLEDQL